MRSRILLGLLLAALLVPAARAYAGGPLGFFAFGSFSGSAAAVAGAAYGTAAIGFAAAGETFLGGWRDDPALLIVDASPHDAEVYLDGRRLGAAGELVALALPVPYGAHTVQVIAPGHRSWARQFVADGAFPIRIRATLTRAAE